MKRKFLSMALVAVLATTMLNVPVTAYAGEATVKDTADEGNAGDLISGEASIGGEQSIDVTSKEIGNEHKIIYSIDISWGAMKFEYNYGSAWDPVKHEYTSTKAKGEWKESCLDGTNNCIYVNNNSNYPVSVDLVFKKEDGRFNLNNSQTSVRGIFNDDLDKLKKGINGTNALACGTPNAISFDLTSADTTDQYTESGKTDHASINSGATDKKMYFGLWGTPDKGLSKNDGAKAGTITVTVTPYQK